MFRKDSPRFSWILNSEQHYRRRHEFPCTAEIPPDRFWESECRNVLQNNNLKSCQKEIRWRKRNMKRSRHFGSFCQTIKNYKYWLSWVIIYIQENKQKSNIKEYNMDNKTKVQKDSDWQRLEHQKYVRQCHRHRTNNDEDWESLRVPEDARKWQQLEHRKFIKLKYQSMWNQKQ